MIISVCQSAHGCTDRRKKIIKCPPMLYDAIWGSAETTTKFSHLSESKITPKNPNGSLFLYCSIVFFLLLIAGCLLGRQTCWWPLKSVCVSAVAWICVCVIKSVSNLSMCSLCVLSCYHIFSCSLHRLPAIRLKSGLLFHRVSKWLTCFLLFCLPLCVSFCLYFVCLPYF